MLLLALALFLIAGFLYNPKSFPYLLVTYFVFYDMVDGFYEEVKFYAVLRYTVPLFLIGIYMLKYYVLKKLDFIFVLLITYLMILWAVNSGDQLVTMRNLFSVVITLLMIPIGKQLTERDDVLSEFEKYNRILLISIPFYIAYANVTGLAGYYTEAFSTGFLVTSRMYIVPIVVFLAIHYALTNKNKTLAIRTVDITFILINTCILLINTRRTALAMLVGAIFLYTLFNRRLIFKMVLLIFIVIGGLIVSYPLYEERLTAQLEKRDRIQDIDTYEEEGRYLETLYILDYHKNNGDIGELLFGVNLFDTYGFGIMYFGRDRPIHSDINMIFFSTGIIGILLFIRFFAYYFMRRNRLIAEPNKKLFYPLLIMLLIVLIPGRFIGTLTYAPLLLLLLTTLKYGYHLSDIVETEERELVALASR